MGGGFEEDGCLNFGPGMIIPGCPDFHGRECSDLGVVQICKSIQNIR